MQATAKKKRGRKKGYISTQRKFSGTTRVARIPAHWDVQEIYDDVEYIKAQLEDARREIAESIARSGKGELSNRLEKVRDLLDNIEGGLSRSFQYDDSADAEKGSLDN